jgi:3-oxoacyl-[acyl-carrier protein] reductase
MDVRAEIKRFILRDIVGESGIDVKDFTNDESLIDSGVLDSLGMLKLIAFLDEQMHTNIMAEQFRLQDFATLDLICGWVERHGGGDTAATAARGATPAAAAAALSATTKMPSVAELKAAALEPGLRGRVVLVTGASRGLGETIAKLFSLYGSRVAVNYGRNAAHAERVASEIMAAGGEAVVAAGDVADAEQVGRMVERIVSRWGTVDVLVNNAAGDATPIDFSKVSWRDVEESFAVVVKGAFNCCKAVIPLMLGKGAGKIVNIGSLATDSPAPNQLKYVIAKSALVGLTRSLAVDYASRNIQVNLVSPSVVETDLISHIPQSYRARIAQETPMQRNATPQDVAQAVVYLASKHAGFTTGQKIMVTGGAAPFF